MQGLTLRRSTPDVLYTAIVNEMLVSSAGTALGDKVPAYYLDGASTDGYSAEGGNADGDQLAELAIGIMANNKGASTPYKEAGLCQIYGYLAAATKAATDFDAIGFICILADNGVSFDGAATGPATVVGTAIGVCPTAVGTATTGPIILRRLGVG